MIFSLVLPAIAGAADSKTDARAPSFTLPTGSGSIALNDLRGKVVLVDFWASWCPPCRQSFPWMQDIYNRYSGKGFAIIAISVDKQKSSADMFTQSFTPIPFVIAYDPSGKTADAFHLEGMPSSYLIDRSGTIIYSHAGFDPKKTQTLENLIEEACSK